MIKTINARFDCRGYYLRWYFNGWHHYFFKVADEIQQTEGQKYQTQMSTKLVVGDDNIRKNQMLAFTGLLRSKHIFMLTEDGWKACTIVDTDLPYGRADHPGARVEFMLNVWAKKGLFTPLLEVNVRPYIPPSLRTPVYGYIYNRYAIEGAGDDSLTSDPKWRVPTNNDWFTIRLLLGTNTGGILKSTRTEPDDHPRWNTPNTGALNTFGFSAHAGGFRDATINQNYTGIGDAGYYWLGDPDDSRNYFRFNHDTATTSIGTIDPMGSYSVRLIRDHEGTEDSLPNGTILEGDYLSNDSRYYDAVKLEYGIWTIENHIDERNRSGEMIPLVVDNEEWGELTIPARSAYQSNLDYVYK